MDRGYIDEVREIRKELSAMDNRLRELEVSSGISGEQITTLFKSIEELKDGIKKLVSAIDKAKTYLITAFLVPIVLNLILSLMMLKQ